MFNIIDFETQYKSDFILMKRDEYSVEAFKRREEINYYGRTFFLISVEDLIIAKLIWVQDSQSIQQITDITNLIKIDSLDWLYMNKWIKQMNLKTFNLIQND